MSKLIVFSDPGHSWLRVTKKEIRDLGLEYVISECSYESKLFVYLEEDCDMGLYIRARGLSCLGSLVYESRYTDLDSLVYESRYTDDRSHVRKLPNYKRPEVKNSEFIRT